MIITLGLVIYFSINTYMATDKWCDTKLEFMIYYLFGIPMTLIYLIVTGAAEVWYRFSNYTGASFYWGFYISGRYKNLSESQLETIKDQSLNNPKPKVRKWAKKVYDAYGGGGKK